MTVTYRLRIAGRVQGVGYRYALRRAALAHGVAGWVRNRHDGAVEAVLQGEASAVAAVIAWARRGPPAAVVDEIQTSDAQGEDLRRHAGFLQLPTE